MFISDFSSGRRIIIYDLEKLCITKIELEIDFKEFILCKIKLSKSEKSNRKAMNRNWSNQKANPALKTKAGNK